VIGNWFRFRVVWMLRGRAFAQACRIRPAAPDLPVVDFKIATVEAPSCGMTGYDLAPSTFRVTPEALMGLRTRIPAIGGLLERDRWSGRVNTWRS
jgi:hypothetical protein